MSKFELASIYLDIIPTCGKCKSGDATLFHMYWLWPQLHIFWIEVFHTLSKNFKRKLDLSSTIALFGAPGVDDPRMISTERHMISFSLLLAILLRWKEATSPTHIQWLWDIMHCLTLEKICFSIRGTENKFYKTWKPYRIWPSNGPWHLGTDPSHLVRPGESTSR